MDELSLSFDAVFPVVASALGTLAAAIAAQLLDKGKTARIGKHIEILHQARQLGGFDTGFDGRIRDQLERYLDELEKPHLVLQWRAMLPFHLLILAVLAVLLDSGAKVLNAAAALSYSYVTTTVLYSLAAYAYAIYTTTTKGMDRVLITFKRRRFRRESR
jgi:hypothetical protein